MRINFYNSSIYSNLKNYCNLRTSQNIQSVHGTTPIALQRDTVSFCQEILLSPTEYLEQKKDELGEDYDNLSLYCWNKLEGLQDGIEIFEGLTFPQVAYLISKLETIAIKRGCHNGCIHCFANAQKSHYMKANNLTDEIDYEDYKKLLDGLNEINKRLGFNAFSSFNNIYKSRTTMDLFHDSDCSAIYLKDKNGKIYDYADLAKMLHDVTGKGVLFDTAGWEISDKQTQKRMEDLVRKVANSNEYDFINFNISINPFHQIYNKYVELKEKGDIEKAQKFREFYIDRMANVIFTFSPLIDKKVLDSNQEMLGCIIRTLTYFGLNLSSELNDYTGYEFSHTCDEIVKKVENLYTQDLMSESPKVIKNERQKAYYLRKIQEELRHIDVHTRLINEKLLSKFNWSEKLHYDIPGAFPQLFCSYIKGVNFRSGIIDVNGEFYMTNFDETYPTDIILNYKNKGHATAPIDPNLVTDEDEIITNSLIELQ